jgi:hypothetical protein
MWEPRPLITLWAFTACYRDSFTFIFWSLSFETEFRKIRITCHACEISVTAMLRTGEHRRCPRHDRAHPKWQTWEGKEDVGVWSNKNLVYLRTSIIKSISSRSYFLNLSPHLWNEILSRIRNTFLITWYIIIYYLPYRRNLKSPSHVHIS